MKQLPLTAEKAAVRKAVERAAVANALELAQMDNNLDKLSVLQMATVEWANFAFPNRTAGSAFLKMFEEMGELVRKPDSPEEYADIFIMLLDLASMHKIDAEQLYKAVVAKLTVNFQRQWLQTTTGVFQHNNN